MQDACIILNLHKQCNGIKFPLSKKSFLDNKRTWQFFTINDGGVRWNGVFRVHDGNRDVRPCFYK